MSENEAGIDTPTPEPEPEREPEPAVVVTKKDPKKVEQGKRLAAISREAKERKMREKIEAEYNNTNKPSYMSRYVFQAISVVSTFGFFYLWFSRSNKDNVGLQPAEQARLPAPKKFETFE